MVDSKDPVLTFLAQGGKITKLPTHSPVTGQIRGYVAQKRHECLTEGNMTVAELPDYLLTYEEKKARGILPHQILKRKREAAQANKKGRK